MPSSLLPADRVIVVPFTVTVDIWPQQLNPSPRNISAKKPGSAGVQRICELIAVVSPDVRAKPSSMPNVPVASAGLVYTTTNASPSWEELVSVSEKL